MRKIAELIPHSGPMLLVDEVLSSTEDGLVAGLTIRSTSSFFRPSEDGLMGGQAGVPSWVGVEYMAQAVAAWAGLHQPEPDGAPRVGFLVAVRDFVAEQPVFALGSRLEVRVTARDRHGPMGVFEGEIAVDGSTVVRGTLSVYEGEPPGTSKGDEE